MDDTKPKVDETNDQGEGDVGGSATDPSSDDNTQKVAEGVGLYDSSDKDSPEVNIAGEIEKDEKAIRES